MGESAERGFPRLIVGEFGCSLPAVTDSLAVTRSPAELLLSCSMSVTSGGELQRDCGFTTCKKPTTGTYNVCWLALLLLSLKIPGPTSLRKEWPYPPQHVANLLELDWIDVMTESHFVQLVVFAGIHHLAHQVITSGFAKNSGGPIERPARSELCHHVGVDEEMRDGKGRLMSDWCFVVSRSDDDKEDIGCLTELI